MKAEWLLQGGERPLTFAFGRATHRIRVIAPYIKVDVLARLLANTDSGVPVTVITRWKVEDIAAGVSDLAVYDLVTERGGSSVLLHPTLHAKLYIVDSLECFVGSANVTAAGLGGGEQHNREILAQITPAPMPLLQFAAALERDAITATEELRDEYAALAAEQARPEAPPETAAGLAMNDGAGARAGYRLADLPATRNPAGLFRLYLGAEADPMPETLERAAHDLALMEVPPGLGEAEFAKWMRDRLLLLPFLEEFDRYLEQPRYFGRMADWVHRRCEDNSVDRMAIKSTVQTLMRWLMYVYPGRYRLEVPRFSERFGRAEGDWGMVG